MTSMRIVKKKLTLANRRNSAANVKKPMARVVGIKKYKKNSKKNQEYNNKKIMNINQNKI